MISGDGNNAQQDTSKLREIIVSDFDKVLLQQREEHDDSESDNARKQLSRKDIDVAFSCMGSTIKAAGSPEAFQKVDRDYVLRSAELLKEHSSSLRQYSIVTSLGSSPNSWFLYPRTKGEVEQGLAAMKMPRLAIFQPALLIADRIEDHRTGEAVAQWLAPVMDFFMIGFMRRYRSINVQDVARGMLVDWEEQWTKDHGDRSVSVESKSPQVVTIYSEQIQDLADGSKSNGQQ